MFSYFEMSSRFIFFQILIYLTWSCKVSHRFHFQISQRSQKLILLTRRRTRSHPAAKQMSNVSKITLIWKQCETPINWIIHELYLAANAMQVPVIFFLFTISTWQPWIILLFAPQHAQNGLNVRDTGWFRMTGTNRHKKMPTGSLNHPQTASWTPS